MEKQKGKAETLKKERGITLIALVITIIVLLILAGVTMSTLTGDNGLLQKAQTATEQNEEAKELELIKLGVSATQVAGKGTLTIDNLHSELQANFNNDKLYKGNNFLIFYGKYKNYIVMDTGEIITRNKWDTVKGNLSKAKFKELVSSDTPKNIIFTNIGGEGQDISEEQDGSVIAWREEETLYVSSNEIGYNVSAPSDCRSLFSLGNWGAGGWQTGIEKIDCSCLDTSNVTNMMQMFYECRNLSSLNISNFDTSKVTNMSYMFEDCKNLDTLNLANFDMSNVINITSILLGCRAISLIIPKTNGNGINNTESTLYGNNTSISYNILSNGRNVILK